MATASCTRSTERIVVALVLGLASGACSLVLGIEPAYVPFVADGADGSSVPPAECSEAGCKTCVPGDYQCVGSELQECIANTWRLLERCASADKCSATGGNCQGIFCLPGQRRCSGDQLERCNATQTAFELETPCQVGLCNALEKRCDACVAGATVGCLDPKTLVQCAVDGRSSTNIACPAATPRCVATPSGGACLACGVDSDCTTTEPCRAPKCTNGACGTVADPTQDDRVLTPPAQGSCNHVVCRGGAAKVENLAVGTLCEMGQGTNSYCTAAGACVPAN
jgi:hypothetical protein